MASESVFNRHQQRIGTEKKRFVIFPSSKRRRFIELERAPECVAVVASSAVCRRVRRRNPHERKIYSAFGGLQKHLNNDETRYL